MKRTILIAACSILLAGQAFCQEKATYGDLIVYRPFFKNFTAQFHTNDQKNDRQAVIRDENGERMKFASEADAVNYISRQGWELVTAYSRSHGGESHYIFKKQG